MELLAAIGFAICNNGNRYIALSDTGQNSIGQGGDALVRDNKFSSFGQYSRTASDADANRTYVQVCTHGQVVRVGGDKRMIKRIGRLRRRNNHQRGTDRALIAVRRAIDYSHLV